MSDLPPPSFPSDLPPPTPAPPLPPVPVPVVTAKDPSASAQSEPAQPQSHAAAMDHDDGDVTAESSEDGTLGLIMYLVPLLGLSGLTSGHGIHGLPVGGVVAPLILWLWKREQSKYVDTVGKEVVNFHLNALVVFMGVWILYWIGSHLFLGWLFNMITFALWLLWIGVTAISAYSANGGHYYRFPVGYRLIK